MMKKNRTFSLFILFALIIGFGILTSVRRVAAQQPKPKAEKEEKHKDDDDDGDEHEPSAAEQAEMAKKAKITKEQATAIALKRVPGEVLETEIEKDKGKLIWSFDIETEEGQIMDVEIDANTGAVLKVEEDTEDESDGDGNEHEPSVTEQAGLAKQAKITKEQATEIALKRVPGEVKESEIEKEKGKLIWSFDIQTSEGKIFDVEIDANSGRVLKVEEDTEDESDSGGVDTISQILNSFEKAASGIRAATAVVVLKISGK
jgi:uncharacterized membrane protein YkoI